MIEVFLNLIETLIITNQNDFDRTFFLEFLFNNDTGRFCVLQYLYFFEISLTDIITTKDLKNVFLNSESSNPEFVKYSIILYERLNKFLQILETNKDLYTDDLRFQSIIEIIHEKNKILKPHVNYVFRTYRKDFNSSYFSCLTDQDLYKYQFTFSPSKNHDHFRYSILERKILKLPDSVEYQFRIPNSQKHQIDDLTRQILQDGQENFLKNSEKKEKLPHSILVNMIHDIIINNYNSNKTQRLMFSILISDNLGRFFLVQYLHFYNESLLYLIEKKECSDYTKYSAALLHQITCLTEILEENINLLNDDPRFYQILKLLSENKKILENILINKTATPEDVFDLAFKFPLRNNFWNCLLLEEKNQSFKFYKESARVEFSCEKQQVLLKENESFLKIHQNNVNKEDFRMKYKYIESINSQVEVLQKKDKELQTKEELIRNLKGQVKVLQKQNKELQTKEGLIRNLNYKNSIKTTLIIGGGLLLIGAACYYTCTNNSYLLLTNK